MTTVTHVSERLLPMSPVCTTFRAFGAENPSFDTTCVVQVFQFSPASRRLKRLLQQSRWDQETL